MIIKDVKILYWIMILLFVSVIAGSLFQVYKNMGGLEEVQIQITPPIKRTVVGKTFKTRYTDKLIEEHFVKCRALIENNHINGDLIVITFVTDSTGGNYVEQFVGIALEEEMAEIPVDFEVIEYQSKDRYCAFLTMHPLVRPTPEQIEKQIFEKAKIDGNAMRPFVMEIHYQNNTVVLECWVE